MMFVVFSLAVYCIMWAFTISRKVFGLRVVFVHDSAFVEFLFRCYESSFCEFTVQGCDRDRCLRIYRRTFFGNRFAGFLLDEWFNDILIACILVFAVSQSIGLIFLTYELASEQIKIAKELEEKRIKLMMSQMQPHFIYNALSIIRGMTLDDPEKAYEMIYHFSKLFKA